jgi:transcriptional regulator with XRE-family HTH domain
MDLIKTIAKNIRKLKVRQKTSFLKIAKKAGIPFTTLETILYKKRADLKISTLMAIAKALKVSLDELVK